MSATAEALQAGRLAADALQSGGLAFIRGVRTRV
jgi:hypothetical protein